MITPSGFVAYVPELTRIKKTARTWLIVMFPLYDENQYNETMLR